MPKLEMVTDFERLQRRIDLLQQQFPALQVLTRSLFFCILGCHVPAPLSQEEEAWLQALIDAQVIYRFRCKEREDR